jgi:AT-rich DNA-binding protein
VPDYVSLPLPTLKRLPLYLELFEERGAKGDEWLSSEAISRRLGFTAIQVRKDLGLTGSPASPRLGFRVAQTTERISEIIGAKELAPVVLIGAGARGEAACADGSLATRGFTIAAVFDPEPRRIGTSLGGFKVLPLAELPPLAKRMRVSLAILAARESEYPGCLSLVEEAGIRGLVNLSGEPVEEAGGLAVVEEDLGFELASLARIVQQAE